MTMYYASIGGVRIQTWIAQSATKLSLVRGASILLKEQTGKTAIEKWLGNHRPAVSVADDAGDVDGVVVLRSPDEQQLRTAVQALTKHLEEQIPGLSWEGWISAGETYLDAYAANDGNAPWIVSLPLLPELGLEQTCGYCGLEPAIKSLTIGDETHEAGPSCVHRRETRDTQEREARTDQIWSEIPGTWPSDFDALARRGGLGGEAQEAVGRKDSRSHLATVAADGNSVGALFREISNLGQTELRREAVQLLNETTIAAVTQAANACVDQPQVKVVIPHFVGGDDIFASVAAPSIWIFAERLARGFEELKYELMSRVPEENRETAGLIEAINGLGLGIGIALARRSLPISTTNDAAHRALSAAKAATGGGASAVGWVDLTSAADTIHTVEVQQLAQDLKEHNAVFKLPASARAALASLVRSQPEDLAKAVEGWGKRTGYPIPEDMVPTLPATLSRARWWPNLPEEE